MLLVPLGLGVLLSLGAARAELDEAQAVKLGFLFNFAKFVTWPDAVLPEGGPFTLCVAVQDAVYHDMRAAVAGRAVRGRPFRVRAAHEVDDLGECQILYLDDRHRGRIPEVEAVAERPVLTVGDSRGFAQHGIVGFYVTDRRLRFAINVEQARRAGLHVNARLLALARVIDDD